MQLWAILFTLFVLPIIVSSSYAIAAKKAKKSIISIIIIVPYLIGIFYLYYIKG